jgi:hypothetical protein
MLLALSTARVNSINILEEILLQRTDLNGEQKNQIGSDAGDWITNIKHQPRGLRPANIAAFGAFALAAAAVAIGSLFSVLRSPPNYLAFVVGAVVHAVFIVFLLSAARTLFFGDIITKIRDRPKYKSYCSEFEHSAHGIGDQVDVVSPTSRSVTRAGPHPPARTCSSTPRGESSSMRTTPRSLAGQR